MTLIMVVLIVLTRFELGWLPCKHLRAIFRLIDSGGTGIEADSWVTPRSDVISVGSIVELFSAPGVHSLGQVLGKAVPLLLFVVLVLIANGHVAATDTPGPLMHHWWVMWLSVEGEGRKERKEQWLGPSAKQEKKVIAHSGFQLLSLKDSTVSSPEFSNWLVR